MRLSTGCVTGTGKSNCRITERHGVANIIAATTSSLSSRPCVSPFMLIHVRRLPSSSHLGAAKQAKVGSLLGWTCISKGLSLDKLQRRMTFRAADVLREEIVIHQRIAVRIRANHDTPYTYSAFSNWLSQYNESFKPKTRPLIPNLPAIPFVEAFSTRRTQIKQN
jgi:hypothetical protein